MTDQEKMQRMLQLIILLGGGKYSMKQLTERLETTERTVFRYLNTLESVGFVLDRENGYQLLTNKQAGKIAGRLFHFSEEEAFILCQMLEQTEGEQSVKSRLLNKLHALYDFRMLAKADGDRSFANIAVLADAIRFKKRVILKSYRSSNSNTIADREVEPFSFLPDCSAIWCYDPEDKLNKLFRVSRIKEALLVDINWSNETAHRLPFVDAFRVAAEAPLATVVAILNLKSYNLLLEEFPGAAQYVVAEDNHYRLTIPVADYHGVGRFVLGLWDEVQVKGPSQFLDFLSQKQQVFEV